MILRRLLVTDPQRIAIANALRASFTSARPHREAAQCFAADHRFSEALVLEIVDELPWPTEVAATVPQEATPFLLIHLTKNPRPGDQLTPECHIRYAGWDSQVLVRPRVVGQLDELPEPPRIDSVASASGHWIFHQPISLKKDGEHCQTGEYVIHFDCHFHKDAGGKFDSEWTGWVKFRVYDDRNNQVLEIESEGHGKINLNGVDLHRFATVKFKAGEWGCVNAQQFREDLCRETSQSTDFASQTSVVLIQLYPKASPPPPMRSNTVARIDLPSDRRIVLFAQEELILGRNRPDPLATEYRTDVALRMLPRTEDNNSISEKISRVHLKISACKGQVEFFDPRDIAQRSAKPATLDGHSLPATPISLLPGRPYHYESTLGSLEQIGLDIIAIRDEQAADHLQEPLDRIPRRRNSSTWKRDSSHLDALLIERSGFSDDSNGREAYLMLMGAVLIGSAPHCAIRISGPGVQPEHAALVHWDGQFRLMSWGRAPVTCDQQELKPGQFIARHPPPRHRLRFGKVEVLFAPRAQLEMDP